MQGQSPGVSESAATSLHYLAYGSNLHPVRLGRRIRSAAFAGIVELRGWALSFCKRSRDGSAKCTLLRQPSSRALAAVYEIDPADRTVLDRIEGLDRGYDLHWEEVQVNGEVLSAFLYLASPDYTDQALRPYLWYQQLVLAGANHHGFPADYVAAIERWAVMEDPDQHRQSQRAVLLADCIRQTKGLHNR